MTEEILLKQDYIPVIEGASCTDRPHRFTEANPPAAFQRFLEDRTGREEYVLNRAVIGVLRSETYVFYYYTPRDQGPWQQALSARRALILAEEKVADLVNRTNAAHPGRTS